MCADRVIYFLGCGIGSDRVQKSRMVAKLALTAALAAGFATTMLRSEPLQELPKAQPAQVAKTADLYDIQISATLDQPTRALEMVVTAVPQTNAVAVGYLLNGYTDDDKWYQVGLSGRGDQFRMVLEVWDHNAVIYNIDLPLRTIKTGDQVALKLAMGDNGKVMAEMWDADVWKEPVKFNMSWTGSKTFIGLPGKTILDETNKVMHITHSGSGMMMEMYTTNRYAAFGTQWFQLNYPAVTNPPLYSIIVGKEDINNIVFTQSRMEGSLVDGRIHGIGRDNTFAYWGPRPNLFMAQDSTNIVEPQPQVKLK